MYFFAVAAAVMTLLLVVVVIKQPRPAQFLALVLWAAYAVWEYFIANGTLCDANCNIRVDLVLFFPILGIATYLAMQKHDRTGAAVVLTIVCLVFAAAIASMAGKGVVAAAVGLLAVGVALLGWMMGAGAKRM